MNNRSYRWLPMTCSLLFFFPTMVHALTAQEVIAKAAENLQGPKGKTVVAQGKMRFGQRDLDVRIARYCQDGTEGFQIDILSPMEDQEVPGAGPQTNKKYRVVRSGADISTLDVPSFPPSGSAVYELPGDSSLTFSLQDFVEFTPGYWAPGKVIANETNFVFEGWKTREPLNWLHSTNHNMFDSQSIPRAGN